MKAYSGEHTQGCHKCGGFPGSMKTPVNKLFQCMRCGFFTCNKHLKGGFSKECPNCAASGKDLRSVMTKQSHQNVKAGGMPGHVQAKAQKSSSEMEETAVDVDDKPKATFGGGGSINQSKSKRSKEAGTVDATPAPSEVMERNRVQEALNDSIRKDVDSLKSQMDSLHSLATVTQDELVNLRENHETLANTPQKDHTLATPEMDVDLSAVSLDDLLAGGDENLAKPVSKERSGQQLFGSDDEEHDDQIDFEALEAMSNVLKDQEKGLSLTKTYKVDAFYRVDTLDTVSMCEDYLKRTEGHGIHLLGVSASDEKIVKKLKTLVSETSHIFLASGYGPKSIQNNQLPNLDHLDKLLTRKYNFIALGEISLDLHFAPFTIELQKKLFAEQVKLATKRNLPVLISSKKADKELYTLMSNLRKEGVKPEAIVVPVVRTVEMFQMILDHSCHLLIRPEITHEAEDLYRECIKEIPIEKLLLASGEEISAPEKYYGRWNLPSYIDETINCAADLLKMEPKDFLRQMAINFNKIFNSDPEAGDDEFDFTPTHPGHSFVMTEEKLLENDIDADGDELYIKDIDDTKTVGSIYFDRQKRLFVYTPKEGFIGADKFYYVVTDGRGGYDTAQVTIHVTKPDFSEDDFKLSEDWRFCQADTWKS